MSSEQPSEYIYRPAWWVPGAHLQTLWGKFARRRAAVTSESVVLDTPDGDTIELVRVDAPANAPRILLLHGLEGTVRSHYVGGMLSAAAALGWGADLLVFRGCGPRPNRARRFYHSGETTDLALAVDHVTRSFPYAPLLLAGVSLGGNVLLKWLGEVGEEAPRNLRAAAAVSVPFDLERGSRFVSRGFSKVYERHFLRSLRRKAMAKLARIPDLFNAGALERVNTLYGFDDVVTAPVHGFRDAHDYYSRSSSLGWLERIRVPTLLLSAADDPFLPREVLDEVRVVARRNDDLHLEFVDRGGHVGFVSGVLPWKPVYYAERRVISFFQRAVDRSVSDHGIKRDRKVGS
jgi:uncharacterized protein